MTLTLWSRPEWAMACRRSSDDLIACEVDATTSSICGMDDGWPALAMHSRICFSAAVRTASTPVPLVATCSMTPAVTKGCNGEQTAPSVAVSMTLIFHSPGLEWVRICRIDDRTTDAT